MKIGGNNFELRTSARTNARRMVEKANAASSFHDECPREPVASTARTERRGQGRASRIDTRYCGAADRRGTESRFVAQVLGQILGPSQDGLLLAARAYARSNRDRTETRLVRVL